MRDNLRILAHRFGRMVEHINSWHDLVYEGRPVARVLITLFGQIEQVAPFRFEISTSCSNQSINELSFGFLNLKFLYLPFLRTIFNRFVEH